MIKLIDVVDNEVVKNTKFNTLKKKVNNSKSKMLNAATLIRKNQNVDKKIPDTSGLVTAAFLTQKLVKLRIK